MTLKQATATKWVNTSQVVMIDDNGDGTFKVTLTVGTPLPAVSLAIIQRVFPEMFGSPPPPNLIPVPPPPPPPREAP